MMQFNQRPQSDAKFIEEQIITISKTKFRKKKVKTNNIHVYILYIISIKSIHILHLVTYLWIIRDYSFNHIKPLLKYPLLNQENLVEREK